MGPVMNLALAVVVMAVVLYQGAQVPAFEQQPVVIGSVDDRLGRAEAAGLKAGDRIVAVDGKPVENWEEFSMAVLPKAKRQVTLGVERDGQPADVSDACRRRSASSSSGDIGILPVMHPQIVGAQPGRAGAARPGCRPATSSWRPTASGTSRANA